MLQYMTQQHRWGRLERGVQLFNLEKLAKIVCLLCSMWNRAEQKVQSVLQALSERGVTPQAVSWHAPCLHQQYCAVLFM
jgi:hypothetical protein